MGKYDFSELYKDATILDQDFLRNEFGYDIGSEYDEIIYKNYYVNICSAIYNHNVYRPSTNEIEEFLKNGKINKCGCEKYQSAYMTELERKYLFLLAQAKQLKYDQDNGRGSMIRGEDDKFTLCQDSYDLLSRIGLIKLIRH